APALQVRDRRSSRRTRALERCGLRRRKRDLRHLSADGRRDPPLQPFDPAPAARGDDEPSDPDRAQSLHLEPFRRHFRRPVREEHRPGRSPQDSERLCTDFRVAKPGQGCGCDGTEEQVHRGAVRHAALRPWHGERTRRTEKAFLPWDWILNMFQKVFGETNETDGAKKTPPASTELPMQSALRPEGMVARNTELKVFLHEKLLGMLNLGVLDKVTRDDLGRQLAPLVRDLLASENIALNNSEYNQIVTEVLDEVLGLGPLEPFLKDPTVSDILVNTYRQVYVERTGRLEPTPAHFKDERHLMRIIQKIVGAVGRRVDESQPWVDARLADGSRVNVLVPPCAVDGPLVSIRKFSKTPLTVAKLVELGTIDRRIALALEIVVRS